MAREALDASILQAEIATYQRRTRRSRDCYDQSNRAMPGGDTRTATFFAPYPTFMDRGTGSRLYDVDGNSYLDLLGNFTSLVHGHAHPRVTEAISKQSSAGTALGAPSMLQVELADILQGRCPSLEKIRFCNSGTEANMYAVRAARAFTRRRKILKMEGAYHGGYDPFRVSVSPGVSPPDWPAARPDEAGLSDTSTTEVLVAPFNNLAVATGIIEKYHGELAAVIVEPVMSMGGMISAEPEFLHGLREVTKSLGLLMILDEVVTFRLAVGGGQAMYHLQPDLTTLGKLIGGGLPIGAFGGRADIMAQFDPRRSSALGHSGTFNGASAVMAAGIETFGLLTSSAIDRINGLGEMLRAGFRKALAANNLPAQAIGKGSLSQVHFVDGTIRQYRDTVQSPKWASRLLHLALMNRGVFTATRGMVAISTAMEESDVEQAIKRFEDAIRPIATAHATALAK